jgi:hypothetical protein
MRSFAIRSVAGVLSCDNFCPMLDRKPIDEWMRAHRHLMEQEAAFSELAVRVASGEVALEELEDARAQLLALRDLSNAVYSKAFPSPLPSKGNPLREEYTPGSRNTGRSNSPRG